MCPLTIQFGPEFQLDFFNFFKVNYKYTVMRWEMCLEWGVEPTSLAFRVSVLSITPPRLPDVTTLPMSTCLCGSFHKGSEQTTTLIPVELELF